MKFLLPVEIIKTLLPILAIIAGIFVISTKNPIISVFNLIVLYILVAFYLIFIGLTYLGISYIVVYIGAIAILFLFVIMMIDVEVVEKRSNNYLPLLFLLLGVFFFTLKNNLYNLGLIKMKSLFLKEEYIYSDQNNYEQLFSIRSDLRKETEFDTNISIVNFSNDLINHTDINYGNVSMINNYNYNYNKENIQILMSDIKDIKFFNNRYIDINFKSDFNINNLLVDNINNNNNNYIRYNILDSDIWKMDSNLSSLIEEQNDNYLLITTNWNSAINKITQISSIGDVLYTIYHSYIYVLSVILLLGLVGAIILTADSFQEIKTMSVNKMSSIFMFSNILIYYILHIKKLVFWKKFCLLKLNINILSVLSNFLILLISFINMMYYIINRVLLNIIRNICYYIFKVNRNIIINDYNNIIIRSKTINNKWAMPTFLGIINIDNWQSESIIGNLNYFIIISIFIAILLLFINSYFSLNVKYLEKEGGFECGFTSFLQTRERFNIIFYRVSLLFLVFDLEIILIYPYPAIFQKNQNISKNNVLVFIYILVIGFIYELKEGALNIVKKGRITELDYNNSNKNYL